MAPTMMTSAFMAVAVALGCASFSEAARGTWLSQEAAQDLSRNSYTRNLLQAPAFSYGEMEGYKKWDGICQQGAKIPQTPIDIPAKTVIAAKTPAGDMSFKYANFTGASALHKNGVQVNSPMGNTLTADKETWTLLQYHFHSPSEHTLNGRYADMEIHLVHQNMKTEKLAVVGVLMNIGNGTTNSSALMQALAKVPPMQDDVSAPFTLASDTFTSVLTPAGGIPAGKITGSGKVPAVKYTGSLTTPPCTAGVQWYVLVEAAPVGLTQVLEYQRLLTDEKSLGQNRRPIQPLLARTLTTAF